MTAAPPDILILGAAKCGTSSLHAWLAEHPAICMSEPKEPKFFEAEFEQGFDFYRHRYFPHLGAEPLIGESRHRNLYLPFVRDRIAAMAPEARFIVMFRDPIKRAYSHWWHWYSRGFESLPFPEAIAADLARIREGVPIDPAVYQATIDKQGIGPYRTYVDSGYYAEQLAYYYECFPREQFKVLVFEDLATNPGGVLAEVCEFLGVDAAPLAKLSFDAVNERRFMRPKIAVPQTLRLWAARLAGRPPREGFWLAPRLRPPMHAATRDSLEAHFAPHNARLRELINRPLPDWS